MSKDLFYIDRMGLFFSFRQEQCRVSQIPLIIREEEARNIAILLITRNRLATVALLTYISKTLLVKKRRTILLIATPLKVRPPASLASERSRYVLPHTPVSPALYSDYSPPELRDERLSRVMRVLIIRKLELPFQPYDSK